MQINYDQFRKMQWNERVTLFNEVSNEEKAELVRTHIDRWLESHRGELSPLQISAVEQCRDFIKPELYGAVKDSADLERFKEIEQRAAAVLTRDQMREALTMHW